MKTRQEILALWKDYDKCPDFEPVLEELLKEREQIGSKLWDLIAVQKESAHDEYMSGMLNGLICAHAVVTGTEPDYVQVSCPPVLRRDTPVEVAKAAE